MPLTLDKLERRHFPPLIGRGGGGTSTPKEVDDNYRSKSLLSTIHLVSAGPCGGLLDQSGRVITDPNMLGKGVSLDRVWLISDDGTLSIGSSTRADKLPDEAPPPPDISDFAVTQVLGTQDQPALANFPTAEQLISVGVAITKNIPHSVRVDNPDADSIEVGIKITSGLFVQNKTTGAVTGTTVEWKINIYLNGSATPSKTVDVKKTNKISGEAIYPTVIDLPKSGGIDDFWDVEVVRVTDDPDTIRLHNQFAFDYLRVSVSDKFSYPNSFLVGIKFDAANINQVPVVGFHVRGRICQVPSNYFPETRKYTRSASTGNDTGKEQDWDGTFYPAWTNNPAWVLYDLITEHRDGLGEHIDPTLTNKWNLYKLAKYNDELVDDGKGGKEPRFVCNAYLQTRTDAYKVLTDFASCCRTLMYWASGSVNFVQDAPIADTAIITEFTNSNVTNGIFNRTSSASQVRHTVFNIRWNDPKDFYNPKYVYYDDPDGIARYGIRPLTVAAFGCTSEGQAMRLARYLLWTEIYETEVINFETGLPGAYLRPNDVIKVADKDYSGVQAAGRVLAISVDRKTVTLDRTITVSGSPGTKLAQFVRPTAYNLPEEVTSSSQIDALRNSQLYTATILNSGTVSQLTLLAALPSEIEVGAMWLFEGEVAAEQYRILTVEEKAPNKFEITANRYDINKFNYTEDNLLVVKPPVSKLANPIEVLPPKNLWCEEGFLNGPEGIQKVINVHWTKPDYSNIRSFRVEMQFETGAWNTLGETVEENFTVPIKSNGTYNFRVTSINVFSISSIAATTSIKVGDIAPVPMFQITGLEIAGQGNDDIFQSKDVTFDWQMASPVNQEDFGTEEFGAGIDYIDPYFDHFVVKIYRITDGVQLFSKVIFDTFFTLTYDANQLLIAAGEKNASGPYSTFRFEVTGYNTYGQSSTPVSIIVSNPPPSPPYDFVVYGGFRSFYLRWQKPAEIDLDHYEIWASDPVDDDTPATNSFSAAKLVGTASATSTTFIRTVDQLVTGQPSYFWLRSVDTFGNISVPTPSPTEGASAFLGTVSATDLTDFPQLATAMFPNTVIPWKFTFVNNSNNGIEGSAPGSVWWSTGSIFHKGIEYHIASGFTDKKYIYWRSPNTSFEFSDTNPVDTVPGWTNNDDFQIVINDGGTYELAWYGFANAVIGSAYIGAAAIDYANIRQGIIDDALINDAGISKLAAGSVTAATIAAGAITVDKFALGTSNSLTQNPSFEQLNSAGTSALTWSLFGGCVLDKVDSIDGAVSVKTLLNTLNSGVSTISTYRIPVSPGATLYCGVWVKVSSANANVRLVASYWPSSNNDPALIHSAILDQFAVNIPEYPGINQWFYVVRQFTVPTTPVGCRFLGMTFRSGNNVLHTGTINFDGTYVSATNPNASLTVIDGGKITTGQIKSPNYVAGVSGGIFDLANGYIEANDGVFRRSLIVDGIPVFTQGTGHFTNDFPPFPTIVNVSYDDLTQMSVKVHAPAGKKIRYETGKAVTPTSPFWPNATNTGDGIGPDDFLGIVNSNGEGPDQHFLGGPPSGPYRFTTVWHACVVDPAQPTVLGPEFLCTTTYVPVDQSLWPKVSKPYIYVLTGDNAGKSKGDAGYQIRADCNDTSAIMEHSSDGITWGAYTRGTKVPTSSANWFPGYNHYFRAKRYVTPNWEKYQDSDIAEFSNTTTSLPNQGGGGGGGGSGTKNLP